MAGFFRYYAGGDFRFSGSVDLRANGTTVAALNGDTGWIGLGPQNMLYTNVDNNTFLSFHPTYINYNPAYVVSDANGQQLYVSSGGFAFSISGLNQRANFIGGDFGDSLLGADLNDSLEGQGGNDFLNGNGGDDYIRGGDGNDNINGGAGADTLYGDDGVDTLRYSDSVDGVFIKLGTAERGSGGDAEGDTIYGFENLVGGMGDDTLEGDSAANVISGGSGNDTIIGGAGADTLDGGNNVDTVSYALSFAAVTVDLTLTGAQNSGGHADGDILSSFENIIGSTYDDQLTGDSGANALTGGEGADTLDGKTGADTLIGGIGNDTYYVDDVLDSVTEEQGGGVDTVYVTADWSAGQGQYIDFIRAGETNVGLTLEGNDLAQVIVGGANNDTLMGLGGNDTLIGGAGADRLEGGTGSDIASYANSGVGITASLANASINKGEAAGDTYVSIERLTGSDYSDRLYGSNGVNNVLRGGAGNDTLKGYTGNDLLEGGAGSDIFVFNTALNASTNVDRIQDFTNEAGNNDRFLVDDAFFAGIAGDPAKGGELFSGYFKNLAAGDQDRNDKIVYNQATGELFYDANGLTEGGQTLFAKLTPGTVLTYHDFFVS